MKIRGKRMEIIQVILVDMPARMHGLTVRNEDGSYTILINAGLSAETQCKAYDHEIGHINNHDYDQIYDVSKIEWMRHESA